MTAKNVQSDSLFQIFIKDFADHFGIPDPAQLETQKREIVPEAVQIDTVVSFEENFDFTQLHDCIFPFWGKENIIEYKGENDRLAPMHYYQYSLTELGILTTYLLSKEREDRKERQPLSQKAAKALWQNLQDHGAQHPCTNTILSTTDPVGIRNNCGFKPVETYDHLNGALYQRTILQDNFIGTIATYLVVINALPIHPKNAPLLILSTGKKLDEFCEWLLENQKGITIEEQKEYITYLTRYNLVQNKEVLRKMRKKTKRQRETDYFMIELMAEDYADERESFFQDISKIVLQADSPAEAALKLIQNEEQMEELLALIQQQRGDEGMTR